MITLDLSNIEKSDIGYRISRFPDGQQTVDIIDSFINSEEVKIKSRFNGFRDLELIICANKALVNQGASKVHLYVPYFLGARSDRKFQEGGINYLKQVVCPIVNSQKFKSITVLDPHSDVLEACLDNYNKVDNHILVKWALTDIDNKNGANSRICLVSPDAGAYKKIFDVAKRFNISNIITATKIRDLKTGNIISTEIPDLDIVDEKRELKYVIVDDICDGGRTFIELAKVIKAIRPDSKIYLVVTHGIFSSGLKPFKGFIDQIYTTDSIMEIDSMNAWGAMNEKFLNLVKQFNIF